MSSIPALKRLTVWVRDIERSLWFYRDVIGLQVLERKDLSGPAIASLVGYEDGRMRIAHLGTPGSTVGWIGLYELSGAMPPISSLAPPPRERVAYGQATAVFESADVAGVLSRLRDGCCELLKEPSIYRLPAEGASRAVELLEVITFDPDGVLVSVMGVVPTGGT